METTQRMTPPPPKGRMRGLGDLVHTVLKTVGIERMVKKATKGRDCGCQRRREKLNKAIPFGKAEDG